LNKSLLLFIQTRVNKFNNWNNIEWL